MDLKLELMMVPVTDVDRAKSFYADQVGFRADFDGQPYEGLRFVQLTPPGSACSIAIGTGITTAHPGSVQGLILVVSDIETAHAELASRGVAVGEIRDTDWGRFIDFSDPDGNRWSIQQLPPRPGR